MFRLIYIAFLALLITACSPSESQDKKPQKVKGSYVVALSISDDGQYVITSNLNQNAYLWNLSNQTYRKVNTQPVNIYSANFIKGTDDFIYQNDQTNEVYVVDAATLKTIKTFNPKFATYGQAFSTNLKYYAASENKQLMHIFNLKDHSEAINGREYQYYAGTGLLMRPQFTGNYVYTTTGGGEFWIWDLNHIKDWKKIIKNVGPTMNALSPDGRYVYTADPMFRSVQYNIKTGKTLLTFINWPKLKNKSTRLSNLRFIDQTHFLATYGSAPYPYMYAGLYNVNDLRPYKDDRLPYKDLWAHHEIPIKKLLPLVPDPHKFSSGGYGEIKYPYPITGGYNMAFDTSASTHTLAVAQANGNGIMVYKFNPKTEKLKLIWTPRLENE